MIKASMRGANGTPLLVLGLSRKTVEALFAGRPISVDVRSGSGKEAVVLLMAGETDDALQGELAGRLGPGALVERSEP